MKPKSKQKGRAKKREYGKSRLVLTVGLFSILSLMIVSSISFFEQSNPFNVTLDGTNNETYYIIFPRYSYLDNLSIRLIPDITEEYQSLRYNTTFYLSFDNSSVGTVLINDTINNHTGIYYGKSGQVGVLDDSVLFNKTKYSTFDNISYVDGSNISISFWFKPMEDIDSVGRREFVYHYDEFTVTFGESNLKWTITVGTQSADFFDTNYHYNGGTWYHIVLTTNNSYATLYQNGTMNDTETWGVEPFAGTGKYNLTVCSHYSINYFCNSTIDELMIFNYTLNQDDVNRLYSLGSPSDLKIYTGDNLDYEYGEVMKESQDVVLNYTYVNNILESGCSCTDCSIYDLLYCKFPYSFYSDSSAYLQVNLTNSTTYTNLTISIYNRITESLITQLSQVVIQGFSNYSTTTGLINIPEFPSTISEFTMFTESEGYVSEVREVELTDWNSTQIDIYLFNTSDTNAGNLIVEVYDEFYNYVVGANVKLLEYNSELDSFVEVSQCFSDSNGECIFNVELNEKYYIVTASYTRDGDVLTAQSTTTGQLIKLDNTIIELHLMTSEGYTVDDFFELVITPSNTELVGNTSYLTATFNDASNNEHTVCIGYYTKNGLNEVLQNSICVTASAGIVNHAGGYLLDRDFTWIVKIYTEEDSGKITVFNSYLYEALEGTLLVAWQYYLKPILFFVLLATLALSLYLKNIKIFAISSMAYSPLTFVFYPNLLGGVTISFIIILCICILFLAHKKQEIY